MSNTEPAVFDLPRADPGVLSFLKSRRSNMAKAMTGPGPDSEALEAILALSARVPDHRKLAPWRYVVFQGRARETFGDHIADVFSRHNTAMPEERIQFERDRLLRAPTVVAVISSPVDCMRGTPEWEQVLSAGALCFQMLLAAQAMGFAAQWLTEWFAYDADIGAALGLSEREKVAGFIYIGHTDTPSTERARPEVAGLIQHWPDGMG